MKSTFLLLFAILIVSCSKDDDNNGGTNETAKYLKTAQLTNSNNDTHIISLAYNNNMEIVSYTRGTTTLSYDYEQRKLIRINDTGLNNIPYQFFYTNTMLTSMMHYEDTYAATYNQTENSYNFEGSNLKIGIAGNDLAYVNENNNFINRFTYSTMNKGPMYNVTSYNPYLIPLFSESTFMFLTSKPISQVRSISNGVETVYNAVHTFDNDGYVISTSLRSGSEELLHVQFEYITR